MEASLTHEAFAQHANTKFQVQLDGGELVDLELTEVSELKLFPGQEEFTVLFRGPNEIFLGQGTHSFTHDQMGIFMLFLVPVARDEKGYYYEAVFNRIRQDS